MRRISHKLYSRVVSAALAFVVALSGLSTAVPFLFSQTAGAVGGVQACTTYSNVSVSNLNGWYLGETSTDGSGHNVIVPNGVHVYTDATGNRKAAAYLPVNFALANVGTETIPQAFDLTHNSGGTPGLQLAVDFDGNGTFDGYLVGEAIYGGTDWWMTNGTPSTFTAPSNSGGFGSNRHGTLDQWSTMYPNAKVSAIGWSLGSGVTGDVTIHRITLGCVNYNFGDTVAPVAVIKGKGNSYTPPSVGSFAHNVYRTANFKLSDNMGLASWKINNNATHTASGTFSDANGVTIGSGAYQGVYGNNTITVTDTAGNSSSTAFVLDNAAPTITPDPSSTGSISGNVFSSANFKLYDQYQINQWWVNNGAVHTQTANQYSDANNIAVGQNGGVAGLNTIHVTDQAGNEATYDFYLNNVGPTITVKGKSNTFAPLSTGDFNDDIYRTVNFKLYDETKVDKFQVNSAPVVNVSDNTYSDANNITVGQNGGVQGANTIRVWDIAGNYTDFHFTLDTQAPTASSVSYSTTTWTNGNVTATLNFSEPVDPTSLSGWTQVTSTQFTKVYSANSNETVSFKDLAGNTGSANVLIDWIDKTTPAVTNFTAPTGTYLSSNTVLLQWASSQDLGGSPVSYNVVSSNSSDLNSDGRLATILTAQPAHVTDTQLSVSGFPDGTYYLQVQAVDAAGNVSAWSSPVKEIIVDTNAPTASLNYSTTTPTNQPVTVTLTANEALDPSSLPSGWTETAGSNGTVFTKVYTQNVDNEEVTFSDVAGNPGQSQHVTISNIDTTAPDVAITSPDNTTQGHKASIPVTATVGADAVSYVLKIDGVDVTSGSTRNGTDITYTWNTAGITNSAPHTITLSATDDLGNSNADTPATVTFTLNNQAPTLTINPSNGTDTTPTLTGTSSTENVTVGGTAIPAANFVDNGDGTYSWSYTLGEQSTGQHQVAIVATDQYGNTVTENFAYSVNAVPALQAVGGPVTPPVQTVDTTSPNNQGVLGDQTNTPADNSTQNSVDTTNNDNSSDQAVKGATDDKSQATIFGLAWYWWLLILAVLAIIIWRIIAAYRSRQAQN